MWKRLAILMVMLMVKWACKEIFRLA